MNLFQKYGIKEVADVTFYSITKVGDEEFYLPVLFLDTLKISSLSQKSENVTANGGYADADLISWNFKKKIDLQLEDALFSPASMNMTFGWLSSELSVYTSTIAKATIANKYGQLNYSTFAYPSPPLTEKEWEAVFFVWQFSSENVEPKKHITKEFIDEPYVCETRTELQKQYKTRSAGAAMSVELIQLLFNQINKMKDFGYIDTDNYELDVIDRLERCYVENEEGFTININEQYENLYRYYIGDKRGSYTIYYDVRTMQPLLLDEQGNLTSGGEIKWEYNTDEEPIYCTLKQNTEYFKWTRTVAPRNNDDSILGKTLVINTNTFPSEFKIVGETYIREQATQRDQRYQFVINRATISTDTNIELRADGEPTTFSMKIQALSPPTGNIVELRQFNVEDDKEFGGTKILPQNTKHTYTPVNIEVKEDKFENIEIY